MSIDRVPLNITRAQLAVKIEKRFETIETTIETARKDILTITQNTAEIIELFNNLKLAFSIFIVTAKILKWIATVGGVAIAIWTIWYSITHIGPIPPANGFKLYSEFTD